MKDWAIYYGDGTRFTDEDGDLFDAPRTDVQLISQRDHNGNWEIVSDSDYYYYEPSTGGWYYADVFTLYDYMIRERNPLVIFGRKMHPDRFTELAKRALDELPEKKTRWKHGIPTWARGR